MGGFYLATALLTLSVATGAARASCPGTDAGLRIMTVNAMLLDETFYDSEAIFEYDDEERAQEIAWRIAGADPDIVAIVDALENSGKDSLEHMIASFLPMVLGSQFDYPYYIRWIDDEDRAQDSGMMVFSKHPMVAYSSPYKVWWDGVDIEAVIDGVEKDEDDDFAAFHYYRNCHEDSGQVGYDYDCGSEGLECQGIDCMAAKAAVMIRVEPERECPVHFIFTHTTADYADDDAEERKARQHARWNTFRSIRDLIEGTLSRTEMQSQPVILVGDLNIDGNLNLDPEGQPMDFRPLPDLYHPNSKSEWHSYFDPQTSTAVDFYRCGDQGYRANSSCVWNERDDPFLTDSWAFEHPRADRGQTSGDPDDNQDFLDGSDAYWVEAEWPNPSEGFRFDYVLHNQPRVGGEEYLCLQQVRRMYWDQYPDPLDPGELNTNELLSDHLALVADFGFKRDAGSQCTPKLAYDAETNPEGAVFGSREVLWPDVEAQDAIFDNPSVVRIDYDHDHLWFFLDDDDDSATPDINGVRTFSIGVSDPDNVQIDLYQEKDLSRPWPTFHKETTVVQWGDDSFTNHIYYLPEPPYYVRFTNKVTGSVPVSPFKILFRKNKCTDPNIDFCVLTAEGDESFGWGDEVTMAWNFDPDDPSMSPTDPACAVNGYNHPCNEQSPHYEDLMYFRFMVGRADDGANPPVDLHFNFDSLDSFHKFALDDDAEGEGAKVFNADCFDVKLRDCTTAGQSGCNMPLLPSDGIAFSDPDPTEKVLHANNHLHGKLAPGVPGNLERALLRVRRAEDGTFPNVTINYQQTVKFFEPRFIKCCIEADGPTDEDEIRLHTKADAAPSSCNPLPSIAWGDDIGADGDPIGDMDADGGEVIRGVTVSFIDDVHLRMCESDPGPTDNEHYGTHTFSDPNDTLTAVPISDDFVYKGGGSTCDEADYYYRIDFRAHSENLGDAAEEPGCFP